MKFAAGMLSFSVLTCDMKLQTKCINYVLLQIGQSVVYC